MWKKTEKAFSPIYQKEIWPNFESFIFMKTASPWDKRPRDTRTLQIHNSKLGSIIFFETLFSLYLPYTTYE